MLRRPNHFIRYHPKIEGEEDEAYNYEVSQDDLRFVAELKGSPFSLDEFERLINFFEKENGDDESVKEFAFFVPIIRTAAPRQSFEDIEKIFEVLTCHTSGE